MTATVLYERQDAVAVIAIDRPDRLNALDPVTRQDLIAALRRAAAAPNVRAVVLTGEGRGFCVGHDLAAPDEDTDIHAVVRDTYNPLVRAIARMDKPVIAGVNGAAVGAGMGLALACDLQVMADSAYLSCGFGKVGLVPDSGASTALVRIVGRVRAYEMALSGRQISAPEAQELGLVNRIVPVMHVRADATAWAHDLASGPAAAMALTKRLLRTAEHRGFESILDLEALYQGLAARNSDYQEGVAAFGEKRSPRSNDQNLWIPGGRAFPEDDLQGIRILIKTSVGALAGRHARAHGSRQQRRLQRDPQCGRCGPVVARPDRPRRCPADAGRGVAGRGRRLCSPVCR